MKSSQMANSDQPFMHRVRLITLSPCQLSCPELHGHLKIIHRYITQCREVHLHKSYPRYSAMVDFAFLFKLASSVVPRQSFFVFPPLLSLCNGKKGMARKRDIPCMTFLWHPRLLPAACCSLPAYWTTETREERQNGMRLALKRKGKKHLPCHGQQG